MRGVGCKMKGVGCRVQDDLGSKAEVGLKAAAVVLDGKHGVALEP